MLAQNFLPKSAQPETEVLLCCARTRIDSNTLDRLRALLRREPDWNSLIRKALKQGVLPLLYRNLNRSCPEAVPKASMDQLKDSFRSNVQRSLLLTAELLKLLDLFANHGLSAIPFKGPVLAASVYGDLSLRQFSDLDVLVKQDDMLIAEGLLASQGYQPATDNGIGLDKGIDPADVAYVGPKYYTFVHQNHGTRVDLQWRVAERYFSFSLDDNHGASKLVPVIVAGRSVLTFAPTDLLLVLCAHGAKHQWQELKWICDVAELVRAEKERINWNKLRQEASRRGAWRMLRLGLFLARDLLDAELPLEVSKIVEKDFGRASIVPRILTRLFAETPEPYGDFERVIFYMRTMDRWQDRARFSCCYLSQCLRAAITPTSRERELLPLPAPLSFLYYFLRPLRLTFKYLRLALRRVFWEKTPRPTSD